MPNKIWIPTLAIVLIVAIFRGRSKSVDPQNHWKHMESVDLLSTDGEKWTFSDELPTVLICAKTEDQYLSSPHHQKLFEELSQNTAVDTRLVIAYPPLHSRIALSYLSAPEANRSIYDQIDLPSVAIIKTDGSAIERKDVSSREAIELLFE